MPFPPSTPPPSSLPFSTRVRPPAPTKPTLSPRPRPTPPPLKNNHASPHTCPQSAGSCDQVVQPCPRYPRCALLPLNHAPPEALSGKFHRLTLKHIALISRSVCLCCASHPKTPMHQPYPFNPKTSLPPPTPSPTEFYLLLLKHALPHTKEVLPCVPAARAFPPHMRLHTITPATYVPVVSRKLCPRCALSLLCTRMSPQNVRWPISLEHALPHTHEFPHNHAGHVHCTWPGSVRACACVLHARLGL